MSLTSLYTALTGINNNSQAINVISDNLANMNTVGFKAGQASFSELISGMSGTSSAGNPIVVGFGSSLNGVNHDLSQGAVNYTGTSTDVAIQGNGYFVVSIGNDALGYTRGGKFQYDAEGNLLSSDGYYLMGYMADKGAIDMASGVVPIEIRKGQLIPASATTSMSITVNMDAQAENGTSFSAPIQVFDSLGAKHNVAVTYTKTAAGEWDWSATIPAKDVGGLPDDPPVVIGSGSLEFDENGLLALPASNPCLNIAGLSNGAADMAITFEFRDSQNNSLLTSAASPSGTSRAAQNGYAAGLLTDIDIDVNGVIFGMTDGNTRAPLAQLALAAFPNYEGLQKYNGSTFTAFPSAGQPSIGVAGSGGRGSIAGASLESSNVDMAKEFINLIVAQRAFQANSRVITTSDELYQESINLKR